MPECATCGGEEFDLTDGLYYCSICQTQSQNLREEEIDNEEDTLAYSRQLQVRQQKIKAEKSEKDKGRPWHTHEAWTLVIKKQVEALIDLGASPKLNDLVLRLWVMYLSKCGLAFYKGDCEPLPYTMCRDRDKSTPSVLDPQVTGQKVEKTLRKKRAKMTSVKDIKEEREKEEVLKNLGEDNFYEGDNPFEQEDLYISSDEEEEESEASDNNKSSDDAENVDGKEEKLKKKKKLFQVLDGETFRTNPEILTPKRVLAFSYLGLLYLHDAIAPIDLIRWLDNRKVPFRHITSIIPPDMKFCGSDYQTFRVYTTPTIKRLRYEAALMSSFLGIKGSKEINLEIFCSRYVVELKLPGEFHNIVRTILQLVPHKLVVKKQKQYDARQKEIPDLTESDMFAMAVVVMVLKLLFVLDDVSERKISDFARKFNKKYAADTKLFIFDDWLHHMEYYMENPTYTHFPQNMKEVPNIRDIEPCIKQYVEDQEALSQYVESSISKYSKKPVKNNRTDVKENFSSIFTALQEKYEYHYSHGRKRLMETKESPSKQSDGCPEPNSLISMLEESSKNQHQQNDNENKTVESPLSISGGKFKLSTVRFILQDDFVKEFDVKFGCKDGTVSHDYSNVEEDVSSRMNVSFEDLSLDTDSANIAFSQSEFITSTQTCSKSTDSSVNDKAANNYSTNDDAVNSLMQELENWKKERKYWFCQLDMQRPRSYDRVLRLCSNRIGCDNKDLHLFVRKVEIMYLSTAEQGQVIAGWKNRYLKQYFNVPLKENIPLNEDCEML